MNSWLDAIPEAQRDVAHSAVVAAFGSDTVLTFRRVLRVFPEP
jgi:hypothetical protein